MRVLRRSKFVALVVVTLAGCGGRTQGKSGGSGEQVTVDTGDAPTSSTNETNSPTVTSPPTGVMIPPSAVPTTTPVITDGTDIPTTSPIETTTPVIVSPPHETGCPVPQSSREAAVSYAFSDGVTPFELKSIPQPAVSQWCADGRAGSTGVDYSNWGAGFGAFVGSLTERGEEVAFDAAARHIVGMRFHLEVVMPGIPIRLMLTELDSPEIAEAERNYEANAFIWGGSAPRHLYDNGSYEVRFSDLLLPSWATVPEPFWRPLDPSRLHSFQFLVPNHPGDDDRYYSFCVSGVAWVDACGNTVALSVSANQPPVIPAPLTPDPSTPDPGTSAAPDSSFPSPDSTSTPDVGTDVGTVEPVGSAPLESSDVPWVVDAGVSDPVVTEPASDAGGP